MSYDLALLHGVEKLAARPGIPILTSIGLAKPDGFGELVTGLQEIVQRFTLVFLTEQGSVAGRPNYGTNFMTKLRQGRLRTDADVRVAYSSALMDVKRQLAVMVADDDPPEQVFENAELISASVADGRVLLSVKLITAAGETPKFTIPVQTLPRNN